MTDSKGFRPRGLGEVAIRCADMAAMVTFYEEVIGLERLSGGHRDATTFFEIADGFSGHSAVLALFQQPATKSAKPVAGADSALHHIALTLPFGEQDAVMRWYEKIDQPYRVEHFGWIGWRGISPQDPECNTVELVAHDASLLDDQVE